MHISAITLSGGLIWIPVSYTHLRAYLEKQDYIMAKQKEQLAQQEKAVQAVSYTHLPVRMLQ